MFTFISNNAEGTNPIRKLVAYVPLIRNGGDYYNLEFGDLNPKNGDIDDLVVTDNGDMRRVLRTVVSTLETFLRDFRGRTVLLDGSNSVRRAYYHKLIRDYRNFITPHFSVKGCIDGVLESFRPGVEYEFIEVSKRSTNPNQNEKESQNES